MAKSHTFKMCHSMILLTSLVTYLMLASRTETAIATATLSATSTSTQTNKTTLYACEEKSLQIECQPNQSIQLIRANYGRFSIQICNDHVELDLFVNCQSPSSRHIIEQSCQGKQSCQLLASNSIFGDSCPGTPKYLEVHYQCVALTNNLTQQPTAPSVARQPKTPNVIASAYPQHPAAFSESPAVIQTSESPAPPMSPRAPALPLWVPPLSPAAPPATAPSRPAMLPQQIPTAAAMCPELMWRHMHWPQTPAGQTARQPCPAHALSGAPAEPRPASLQCLADGQWANHVHASGCQSVWLRNLSHRIEQGDSPLGALGELAGRTRPPQSPGPFGPLQLQPQLGTLFGDDIAQIGRIVRRLVADEMGDLLTKIADDKQRHVFAREMVQSLAELVSNLAHESHEEAWLDLAASGQVDRHRLAAGLAQNLEAAAILLAGTLAGAPQGDESRFARQTENVVLSVRAISLPPSEQLRLRPNRSASIQVSFPEETALLGSSWFDQSQRFTMRLVASADSITTTTDNYNADDATTSASQALKVVFVMSRKLAANQMDASQLVGGTNLAASSGRRAVPLRINSNLVSLAIVADPKFKFAPLRLDLADPIELTFAHLDANAGSNQYQQQQPFGAASIRSHICVYLDANSAEWQTDGCKLMSSNQTHSTCACNHLSTFALLSSLDGAPIEAPGSAMDSASGVLASQTKAQQEALIRAWRPLLAVAGALGALLVLVRLCASLYNRAHEQRLLGGLPPARGHTHVLVSASGATPSSINTTSDADQLSAGNLLYSGDYASAVSRATSTLQATKPPTKLQQQQQDGDHAHEQLLQGLRNSTGSICRLEMPCKLTIHMLASQFLLLVLIRNMDLIGSGQLLHPQSLWPTSSSDSLMMANFPSTSTPTTGTVGPYTWALVLALFYLVGSISGWLVCKLLELQRAYAGVASSWRRFGHLNGARRFLQSNHGNSASSGSTSSSSSTTSGSSTADKTTSAATTSTSAGAYDNARSLAGHPSAGLYGRAPPPAYDPPVAPAGGVSRLLEPLLVFVVPVGATGALGWFASVRYGATTMANGAPLGAQLASWPQLVQLLWLPFALELNVPLVVSLVLLVLIAINKRKSDRIMHNLCVSLHSQSSSSNPHSRSHSNAIDALSQNQLNPSNGTGNGSSIWTLANATTTNQLNCRSINGHGGSTGHKLQPSNANPYGNPTSGNLLDMQLANSMHNNHLNQQQQQHQHQIKQLDSIDSATKLANLNSSLLVPKWRLAKFTCLVVFAMMALHWVAFGGLLHFAAADAHSAPPAGVLLVSAGANLLLGVVCLLCDWQSVRRASHASGVVRLARLGARRPLHARPAAAGLFGRHPDGGVSVGKTPKVSPASQSLFTINSDHLLHLHHSHSQQQYPSATSGYHEHHPASMHPAATYGSAAASAGNYLAYEVSHLSRMHNSHTMHAQMGSHQHHHQLHPQQHHQQQQHLYQQPIYSSTTSLNAAEQQSPTGYFGASTMGRHLAPASHQQQPPHPQAQRFQDGPLVALNAGGPFMAKQQHLHAASGSGATRMAPPMEAPPMANQRHKQPFEPQQQNHFYQQQQQQQHPSNPINSRTLSGAHEAPNGTQQLHERRPSGHAMAAGKLRGPMMDCATSTGHQAHFRHLAPDKSLQSRGQNIYDDANYGQLVSN